MVFKLTIINVVPLGDSKQTQHAWVETLLLSIAPIVQLLINIVLFEEMSDKSVTIGLYVHFRVFLCYKIKHELGIKMKLYKYCKLDHYLITALLSNTIYFSAVSDWDDPADMNFLILQHDENLPKACDKLRKIVINETAIFDPLSGTKFTEDNTHFLFVSVDGKFELTQMGYSLACCLLRNRVGVCCFSIAEPNALLFSQYSDKHKGVCLVYEINEIDKPNIIHPVEYNLSVKHLNFSEIILDFIDDEIQINPTPIAYKPFLLKHDSWKYQKEVRVFNNEGPHKTKNLSELGLKLTGVIFGCRVKPDLHRTVRDSINERTRVQFYEFEMNGIESENYWGQNEIDPNRF